MSQFNIFICMDIITINSHSNHFCLLFFDLLIELFFFPKKSIKIVVDTFKGMHFWCTLNVQYIKNEIVKKKVKFNAYTRSLIRMKRNRHENEEGKKKKRKKKKNENANAFLDDDVC